MPRQLSCRDMCKIVAWFEYNFPRQSNEYFIREIWMMARIQFVTLVPFT